jgi:hypothetical protein
MRLPRFFRVALLVVLVTLGLCFAILSGCRRDPARVLKQEQSWTLYIYNKGRVEDKRVIGQGVERNELLNWAEHNSEGWSLAMQDFVPCLLISGASFRLNVLPSVAAFDAGTFTYAKKISEEDYRRLRQVLAPKSTDSC